MSPQANEQDLFRGFLDKRIGEGHEFRIARDLALADMVPENLRCPRCEGTGNQLFFMYQACTNCNASGRRPLVPYAWAGIPVSALDGVTK